VILKRCGCVDPVARRQLGKDCPRLTERGHGSWYFHCSTTNLLLGRSERTRRGGYPSRAAAERRGTSSGPDPRRTQRRHLTVERWLRYWLSTRSSIRPTTKLHYTRDIERFSSHLGPLRLSEMTSRRLTAIFAEIGKVQQVGQPTSRARCSTCAPPCGRRSTSPSGKESRRQPGASDGAAVRRRPHRGVDRAAGHRLGRLRTRPAVAV
jgi:hypothetical protein